MECSVRRRVRYNSESLSACTSSRLAPASTFFAAKAWNEPSCDWEVLEEVSPLFSEERRLLHAGRAICLAGGRRAGSIVVHSMLDYGNLSFISAQNPYVALVRSQSRPQP